MTPKISIIVPVYKAEPYLNKCIDSLLSQTFVEFEILLINDGSPDLSGMICDEYAKKDGRIRVFHKENGGVSSARQLGLDNANGQYIIHVDPDDWVEPSMLEELYLKAISENADMIICDFFVNVNDKQNYSNQKPNSLSSISVLKELFQHLHGSCCNKLIRKECCCKDNLKFPLNLSLGEDKIFNMRLLYSNPKMKIIHVPHAFYHYVLDNNINSLVKNSDINQYLLQKEIVKNELSHELYSKISIYIDYSIIYRVFVLNLKTSKEFVKEFGYLKYDLLKIDNRPLVVKILLFLSCIGMKRFSYLCYNLLKKIKQEML